MSFWTELRRRNVFKVGVAYAIVAWLVLQVAAIAFPALHLPAWTVTFVTALLLLGIPVALLLAWAYEVTPEGIKRTREVPHGQSITHLTGQKLNYIVTALLVVAVAFIAVDNYVLSKRVSLEEARPASAEAPQAAAASPAPAQSRAPSVLPNSVAVLPFENLSPNKDDAYFAEGIHEEILNYLAKLKSLNVISRTSVVRYANTDKPIQEIAKELNVETVMEGSVRYANDRVRVTTQLIDAATGSHLWSEAYERPFKDIFAIQADIAMNVANALKATFSREEQQRIETPPNVSAGTYALYLQWLNLVATGNQGTQALALLDQMIARDPKFATPYGLKAVTYASLLINTTFGSAGNPKDTEALVRESAGRALALDPNDRQAAGALAVIDLFNWRWAGAREAYERNYAATGRAGSYFNWFNSWTGRKLRAVEITRHEVALNPLDWVANWNLGIVLLYAGDADAAATAFRRGIELAPALSLQHSWLAWAEIARGNPEEAGRELELVERLLGENRTIISLVDTVYSYGRIGRKADAQRVFAEIQTLAAKQDIGAGGWAAVYLGIGDRQKALEQLELGAQRAHDKVLDQGFFTLMNIRMDVTRDPVLEQPEFVAVRNRLTGD